MKLMPRINSEHSCLKCQHSYSQDFEPRLYCKKYNIKDNPNIIGLRNEIPNYWINYGLTCDGYE